MSNAEDHSEAASRRAELYYADPARRRASVRELFNRSARYYDGVNLLFSLGSGAWYRRSRLRRAGLKPGARVVDVAVGTGLLAREALALTGPGGSVIGVDLSEAMLAVARRNLAIPLVQASAEALPLADASADMVTMGYALRHVADLRAALAEARRVLRPGGKLLLLEISAPRHPAARFFAGLVIGGVMPLISLLAARNGRARALMRYHWRTIARFLPPDSVGLLLERSGFREVACGSELGLFHCHTGIRPAGDF